LDIGGKTGSLTGKNPEGKNEWFVGYAEGGDNFPGMWVS
jgi:beta-lactamase class D